MTQETVTRESETPVLTPPIAGAEGLEEPVAEAQVTPEEPAAPAEAVSPETEETGEPVTPPRWAVAKEDGSYHSPEELLAIFEEDDELRPVLEARVQPIAEAKAEEDFQRLRKRHDETFRQKVAEAESNAQSSAVISTLNKEFEAVKELMDGLAGVLDPKDLNVLERTYDRVLGQANASLAMFDRQLQQRLGIGQTQEGTLANFRHLGLVSALYETLPKATSEELRKFGGVLDGRIEDGRLELHEAQQELLKKRDALLKASWEAERGDELKRKATENADAEARAKARGAKPPVPTGGGGAGATTYRTKTEARNLHAQNKISNEEMRRVRADPNIPE